VSDRPGVKTPGAEDQIPKHFKDIYLTNREDAVREAALERSCREVRSTILEAETGFFYENTASRHLILVKNPVSLVLIRKS